MSKPYCSAVNAGLFVSVNGQVGLCCSGAENLGSVRQEPITDIFNKPRVIQLQKNLQSGTSDLYCSGCLQVEKTAPTASQRWSFNNQFPNTEDRQIQLIDIRWSNVCNLSCRYCNSHDSSEWKKLFNLPVETVNRDYTESLFDEIYKHRNSIQAMYVLGGEPLLQKHNEKLLNIINTNTKIDIITNMSVENLENNKIYKKLKQLPNVHWNISFENVNERFEYIRHGAKWSTFVDNIQRLCDDFGSERVGFHPIYHIWSCLNLEEYYEFVETKNFRTHWQLALPKVENLPKVHQSHVLYSTDSFLVFGHNQKIISRAIKEIENLKEKSSTLTAILSTLQNNIETPNQGLKFLEWNSRIEKLMPPAKTFSELWPELNTLLTA